MTQEGCPENCELVLSDGSDIPVKKASVDVCYSKDLLEHLHPDDALLHLQSVYQALVPGGVYICRTPNALSGPHDVSRFFETGKATGLHLKEYTTTEINRECKKVGFKKVKPYLWFKGRLVKLPLWPVLMLEFVASRLPRRVCRAITGSLPTKRLLSRVIITK
jgi:SAM-dependent methyltransferase